MFVRALGNRKLSMYGLVHWGEDRAINAANCSLLREFAVLEIAADDARSAAGVGGKRRMLCK